MNETRSIRNWSGDAASFETDVGQPLEDAIEDAIKTGQPTLLYAVASALVEAYQTDRIRRGLWLDLWDRIGHRRMELQESLQDFEKTEAIIRGVLCATCPDLSLILLTRSEGPPDEALWLNAVQRAFNRAHDDKRSLETLDALLDLSAKVFAFHRDKGESLCDRWREIVRRESKALAAKARCRMTEKNTPPAILSFREAGADQIRVLLGLYVESITKSKQPADADPVNVLAKRIAGDCAEAAEEVADLIRYLTFNDQRIRHLLERRIRYTPWKPKSPSAPMVIPEVEGLVQTMLLVGPVAAGKTSFLFYSEALCWDGNDGKPIDPVVGRYPLIHMEHTEGRQEHIEDRRRDWLNGAHTRTDDIMMVMRIDAYGLGKFQVFDAPGEIVGEAARRGGVRKGHLTAHTKRVLPSVLMVLIQYPDKGDSWKCDENLKQELLDVLPEMGRHKPGRSLPIFLIVNKIDRYLDGLRNDRGCEEDVRALEKKLRAGSFPLRMHLRDTDVEGAIQHLRDQADSSLIPAMRALLIDTLQAQADLLNTFVAREFRNITVSFTCSQPTEDMKRRAQASAEDADQAAKHAQTATAAPGEARQVTAEAALSIGVGAFWHYFWTECAPAFGSALETHAMSQFVTELRSNVDEVLKLLSVESGLALDALPMIDPGILDGIVETMRKRAQEYIDPMLRDFRPDEPDPLDKYVDRLVDKWAMFGEMQTILSRLSGDLKGGRSEWERRARLLVRELHLSPDEPCSRIVYPTLSPGEAEELEKLLKNIKHDEQASEKPEDTEGTIDLKQIRAVLTTLPPEKVELLLSEIGAVVDIHNRARTRGIQEDHIHGYYGLSKDVAQCRRERMQPSSSLASAHQLPSAEQQWISGGGDTPIARWIFEGIKGTKSAAWTDTSLKEVCLWIGGYGFDGTRACESGTDYRCLTPILYEKDPLRLGAVLELKADVQQRLEDVAILLEMLKGLHEQLYGTSSNQNPKKGVVAQAREALRNEICQVLLRQLGFNVDKMRQNPDGALEKLRDGRKTLLTRLEIERGVVGRVRTSLKQKKERVEALAACQELIEEYTRQDVVRLGLQSTNLEQSYQVLCFATSVVERCRQMSADANVDKITEMMKRLSADTRTYNCNLKEYVAKVVQLLLRIHKVYLDHARILKQVDHRLKNELEHSLAWEYQPMISAGMQDSRGVETLETELRQRAHKVIDLFEEIVEQMVGLRQSIGEEV